MKSINDRHLKEKWANTKKDLVAEFQLVKEISLLISTFKTRPKSARKSVMRIDEQEHDSTDDPDVWPAPPPKAVDRKPLYRKPSKSILDDVAPKSNSKTRVESKTSLAKVKRFLFSSCSKPVFKSASPIPTRSVHQQKAQKQKNIDEKQVETGPRIDEKTGKPEYFET